VTEYKVVGGPDQEITVQLAELDKDWEVIGFSTGSTVPLSYSVLLRRKTNTSQTEKH